jgi:MFS family permease
MEPTKYKVYSYRWIVLIVYMFIVAINQLLWITFAPITTEATIYYHVSDLQIGMLSMCFMLVYLVVSIPASWVIDKYGIRIGIGAGAVLTGGFGLVRGFAGPDYNILLLAQIGVAAGQPFLLNALTKLAARWFPIEERATASGLGSLAMYLGILIGMLVTPFLTKNHGINGMVFIYGIISIISAIIFIVFVREGPATPPCHTGQEERSGIMEGLRNTLHNRGFYRLMFIFFIGLGVFNAVATWIEDIVRPRGFTAEQAGLSGGIMITGGIIGAVIMPLLSDHYRKRIPFITIALGGSILGLFGITFADTYWELLVASALSGYFLLSAGPIGFQYGAEITYPTSESTSNGLLLLMGQISGIAFIFGLDSFKSHSTGSMTYPLAVLILLLIISLIVSRFLKESGLIHDSKNKAE